MGIDKFRTGSDREGAYPDSFRKHVINWDWPVSLDRTQREQVENVTAVIWNMMEADKPITEETFKQARDARAAFVREKVSDLEEEYYKTVHKNCVTNLGYRKDNGFQRPMWGFVKESEEIIKTYED